MNSTGKDKTVLQSRIFWKIFSWILLVLAIALSFAGFIIFSNFEAEFSQTIATGQNAEKYAFLKKQGVIMLVLLYTVFAFIGFFSARLLSLRITGTSEFIKKLNNMQAEKELTMPANDEFQEIALNLKNLKLKQQTEKEKFINKIKSDFVTIAAHQLRTPLSIVKWSLYALKSREEGKLNQIQSSYVEKGIISCERTISLINDLLNVSRIEQGEFDYNFQSQDIKEAIRQKTDEFRPKCEKKKIKLSTNLHDENISIKHDPGKIGMVLDNLLSNALKYTPENGCITVTSRIKKDHIEVEISDTGLGIPENEQKSVFQRFFRGEQIMKIDTEGSGLGLFIVKSIVERHKGSVWFKSRDGSGTSFYFTIPIEDWEDSEKSITKIMTRV
jgi:signal transduction histidine kinase